MKIKIKDKSISYNEIKESLITKFNNYKFEDYKNNVIMASKNNKIGANVIIKKNKIIVEGNFPTITGRVIFALSFILLGILIPLVIYLAFFQLKFVRFENELGNFIKEKYNDYLIK